MGIRVKKVMGYGLTNVKWEGKWSLDDPRINADSPFFHYDGTLTLDAYIKFLEGKDKDGKPDRDFGMERYFLTRDMDDQTRRARDPEGCVIWQAEYGLPNVLLLRPVCNTDWYRSDDSIDWLEETYMRGAKHTQETWVRKFRHGFWPYNGAYMDSRDGRRLPDDVMIWIRLREDGRPGTERDQALDALAQHLGFKNHAQANRHIAPVVPGEIRALAEFGELFTDERVILQLRPLLYCYWS